MVKIKVCGITRIEDARAAAQAGADLLGFIFYIPSPRYIRPDAVKEITDALRVEFGVVCPKLVGVFVDETPETVQAILRSSGLDAAQLSGDEKLEDFARASIPSFKAIRAQATSDLISEVERWSTLQDGTAQGLPKLLLDTHLPGSYGGTGCAIPDSVLASIEHQFPQLFPHILLAGGLRAENVDAILTRYPVWGVDVCSGVEEIKGQKNIPLLEKFVQVVRTQERNPEFSPFEGNTETV